jgi:hypothetical protein
LFHDFLAGPQQHPSGAVRSLDFLWRQQTGWSFDRTLNLGGVIDPLPGSVEAAHLAEGRSSLAKSISVGFPSKPERGDDAASGDRDSARLVMIGMGWRKQQGDYWISTGVILK